jgi:3-hydroxyacyl-[acyl-carrier-protein] dehydratase
VKDARFRRKVTPGDVLEMECTLTAFRSGIGFGKAKAVVDGEVAATAELIFAVEKG